MLFMTKDDCMYMYEVKQIDVKKLIEVKKDIINTLAVKEVPVVGNIKNIDNLMMSFINTSKGEYIGYEVLSEVKSDDIRGQQFNVKLISGHPLSIFVNGILEKKFMNDNMFADLSKYLIKDGEQSVLTLEQLYAYKILSCMKFELRQKLDIKEFDSFGKCGMHIDAGSYLDYFPNDKGNKKLVK